MKSQESLLSNHQMMPHVMGATPDAAWSQRMGYGGDASYQIKSANLQQLLEVIS